MGGGGGAVNQFPPILFVREWGTLPEIDPAVPKAHISHILQRGKAQGARVRLQKKTPLERRPATDKKTRIREEPHWVLNPKTQKTTATPTITPFVFSRTLQTPQDPKLKDRAQCRFSAKGPVQSEHTEGTVWGKGGERNDKGTWVG